MPNIIIDSEHYYVDYECFYDHNKWMIEKDKIYNEFERLDNDIKRINDSIVTCKITNISLRENVCYIYFKEKSNGNSIIFQIDNTVFDNYNAEKVSNDKIIENFTTNFDLNNIYKFNLSYTYSVAIHLSNLHKKNIFGIMFWDINDKVMPKSSIWGERLIITGLEI